MREFVCDQKTCTLEPSNHIQTGSGGVKTYNEMSGGSGGLDPVQSTFYIPLKQSANAVTKATRSAPKRRRRALTGGGALRKVKKRTTRKKKSHLKVKRSTSRLKQFGGGKKKRKCVKRKRK